MQHLPGVTRDFPRFLRYFGVFALGVALTLAVVLGMERFETTQAAETSRQVASSSQPDSHFDLLAMSRDELAKVDLGLMNLLCAKGLPGTENLNIPAALAKLDEWAAKVKFETERHIYRVTDPMYAEHYNHSEARLRAEFIVQVLQEDCGVHYNVERIRDVDFSNPQDLFIHGMIGSDNGGTCASMPVIYAVIGRRLGYPIKLVSAKQHLFLRWEGDGEKFNIEGATNGGVDYYSDEYYREWPKPISKQEMERGEYLVSLTPEQELSVFLQGRGDCFRSNGRMPQALAAYSESHRLMPQAFAPVRSMQAVFGAGRMPQMHMNRELPDAVKDLLSDDPTPQIPMPGIGPKRP